MAEKTRADKEGVKLPDMIDQLAGYVEEDTSGMPLNYITFTAINKLGVNPRSEYNTPNGIYAYPLTDDIYEQLKSAALPFAQNQPYVSLIQPQDRDAMATSHMHVDASRAACIKLYSKSGAGDLISDPDMSADYIALMRTTGGKDPTWAHMAGSNSFQQAQSTANNKSPFGILWNLTRLAAAENPNRWSAIWRALGYDGALDIGTGTIHNAEKTQAVFFARDVVDLIKTFANKSTPKKIAGRSEVRYRAAAGKIADAAFRPGGGLSAFREYQSWSLIRRWLEEKIRAQIMEDLHLLYTIHAIGPGESNYPWLAMTKDDIDPRTEEGFDQLAREIADGSSPMHKKFWSHKKTMGNVINTFMGKYRDILQEFRYEAKKEMLQEFERETKKEVEAGAGVNYTPRERSLADDLERIRGVLQASMPGDFKDIERLLRFADEMISKFPDSAEKWANKLNQTLERPQKKK